MPESLAPGTYTLTGQGRVTVTIDVAPEPEPLPTEPEPPRRLPVFVSPDPKETKSSGFVDAYRAHIEDQDTWATGFYTYWGGNIGVFNADWRAMCEAYPDGIPVLGSPKGSPTSNPEQWYDFFADMPEAWQGKFIHAYYQEPEDNHTAPNQRAHYRKQVAATADLVRPFGVRNAVHLQEWSINPYNNLAWAGRTPEARAESLAEFVRGIEDSIDYVSWSLYPARGKSMTPGIDRIKEWTETYLPGKPWGVTAAGSPVPGNAPIGGPDRTERADIVRVGGEYVVETGGQAFGWFNFDEYNPGRDQLASKDPALRDALSHVAGLTLPGSG